MNYKQMSTKALYKHLMSGLDKSPVIDREAWEEYVQREDRAPITGVLASYPRPGRAWPFKQYDRFGYLPDSEEP